MSPNASSYKPFLGGSVSKWRVIRAESADISQRIGSQALYLAKPRFYTLGQAIAFTSFRDGDFEICTIRPDGTGIKRLTQDHGNNAHGAWSADGEWYIFSSGRLGWKDEAMLLSGDQPYADLFAMRPDGSDLRQLTDNQWEEGLPAAQPKSK